MNTFRTISRVLAASAVVLVGNMAAVNCPVFNNPMFNSLENNKGKIAFILVGDKIFDKDQHLNKAFMSTFGSASDKKNIVAGEFAEQFAMSYVIRKGSHALNVDGLRNATLKKCDVLPEGMIRDVVNPVVQQAAEVVTHPEFLTYLAMQYVIPCIVNALGGNTSNVK